MPEPSASQAKSLSVELTEIDGDWSAIDAEGSCIVAAADAVAGAPGLIVRPSSVSIALSSDAEVASLNAAYRGKAKPTNVLSFPPGRCAPPGFLGDIVLASETISREATAEGVTFVRHVQHLVVHGLLHLIGYDHETPADAERMESLEIEILASLGIDNPYSGDLVADANAKE